MKRLNLGAIAVLVVALSTFGLSSATAQPVTRNVDIVLVNSPPPLGVCVLMAPKEAAHSGFLVNANHGDSINWNINNNCTRTVEVGISAFRPKVLGETIDHPLVQAASALKKSVARKSTGTFTGTVKQVINNFGRPTTRYVYDLEDIKVGGARVLFGDPEIEIPN